jgi:hypothetical protein
MPSSPGERPYLQGPSTSQSDHAWMLQSWSAEEWRPCGRRPGGVPADSILVDPSMPGIRECLERLLTDGNIRTAPAAGAKIYIIPMGRGPASTTPSD